MSENQKLREALQAAEEYLQSHTPIDGYGSIDHSTNKERMDALFAVQDALALPTTEPSDGGGRGVVAYRETITARLCEPDDTHRQQFPMCYRPLTYADAASTVDGAFTAGDIHTYCTRARAETVYECKQALQACIDAVSAFQDPAGNYPEDTPEFRDLDDAMKLAEQQVSWITNPTSQQQPTTQAQEPRPQNCGTGYCSCIECLYEPQAQDHIPDVRKMVNGLTEAATDQSASVSGLTAPPVGEREAFEQIIAHRIGHLATERWNDDPDAEYKNSLVEDLRAGWLMHLQWQARAALSAGDAVDAHRYRWLREQSDDDFVFAVVKNPHFDVYESPEELDAAIDAAMRKGQL